GAWGRLKTNAVWNVKLTGAVTEWMGLWLSATNVVDLNNAGAFGYPMPGRQIWAGLKIVEKPAKKPVELSGNDGQGTSKKGEL
ncbi:MAG TPA: hypothetical protein PLZ86_07785, partial [bacterium]|nr:hypothetical protein [bacterium]